MDHTTRMDRDEQDPTEPSVGQNTEDTKDGTPSNTWSKKTYPPISCTGLGLKRATEAHVYTAGPVETNAAMTDLTNIDAVPRVSHQKEAPDSEVADGPKTEAERDHEKAEKPFSDMRPPRYPSMRDLETLADGRLIISDELELPTYDFGRDVNKGGRSSRMLSCGALTERVDKEMQYDGSKQEASWSLSADELEELRKLPIWRELTQSEKNMCMRITVFP